LGRVDVRVSSGGGAGFAIGAMATKIVCVF
jgi:hypothetical protein